MTPSETVQDAVLEWLQAREGGYPLVKSQMNQPISSNPSSYVTAFMQAAFAALSGE
jgi:hypothetical protein